MVQDILIACAKDTGARLVYDDDPRRLIDELLRLYRAEHYRRPSCFCADGPPGQRAVAAGEMTDPVCGMRLLPAAAAATRTLQGTDLVFCSTRCVERFDADPDRYAR